jgi:hypothetical protein
MVEQHEYVQVELAQGTVLPHLHHRPALVGHHGRQPLEDLVHGRIAVVASGVDTGLDGGTHLHHHTHVDHHVNHDGFTDMKYPEGRCASRS